MEKLNKVIDDISKLKFKTKTELIKKLKYFYENNDDKSEINMPYDLIVDMVRATDIKTKKVKLPLFIRKWNDYLKIDEHTIDIKIPKEYKKTHEQFKKLWNTPQPKQRSPEWYVYRKGRITASSGAQAIGECPYQGSTRNDFIMSKCDAEPPFVQNDATHHGVKYEPPATMVYEHIKNILITEFGCLPHPTIDYLGASPDGIGSKMTLDYKFSDFMGVMLEIKCPPRRKIKDSGKIDGEIVPHYYWVQVQLQLECCDLEVCDFLQCHITEYKSRDAYLKDDCKDCEGHETENGIKMKIPDYCKKGVIVQFMPKNNIHDEKKYKAKWIYPPSLNFTEEEYDEWIVYLTDNWQKEFDRIYNEDDLYARDFYWDEVLYWKLKKCHICRVYRDRDWFEENLPKFKETWDEITFYRKNNDKYLEFKDELNFKYPTKITLCHNKLKKNFLKEDLDSDFSD